VAIVENEQILQRAGTLRVQGFGAKDALHLACAVDTHAAFFLTTDKGILRKKHHAERFCQNDQTTLSKTLANATKYVRY
jgi:predicted nucleic acid-binding protein